MGKEFKKLYEITLSSNKYGNIINFLYKNRLNMNVINELSEKISDILCDWDYGNRGDNVHQWNGTYSNESFIIGVNDSVDYKDINDFIDNIENTINEFIKDNNLSVASLFLIDKYNINKYDTFWEDDIQGSSAYDYSDLLIDLYQKAKLGE